MHYCTIWGNICLTRLHILYRLQLFQDRSRFLPIAHHLDNVLYQWESILGCHACTDECTYINTFQSQQNQIMAIYHVLAISYCLEAPKVAKNHQNPWKTHLEALALKFEMLHKYTRYCNDFFCEVRRHMYLYSVAILSALITLIRG